MMCFENALQKLGFLKFMMCPQKWRESQFSPFCADVVYGL